MMDHTLIVYTSNNADKQHTDGAAWPVVLLGNFDGRLKTGQFTRLGGKRPINALYATLLHAATGRQYERFNMSPNSPLGTIKVTAQSGNYCHEQDADHRPAAVVVRLVEPAD